MILKAPMLWGLSTHLLPYRAQHHHDRVLEGVRISSRGGDGGGVLMGLSMAPHRLRLLLRMWNESP